MILLVILKLICFFFMEGQISTLKGARSQRHLTGATSTSSIVAGENTVTPTSNVGKHSCTHDFRDNFVV
jgi:hypothetical protein